MSSGRNQAPMLVKVLPLDLLPQLSFCKFARLVLLALESGRKKQAPLQSQPLWKMELAKGHRVTHMGGFNFSRAQSNSHFIESFPSKDHHLACDCSFNSFIDWYSSNFYYEQQHNTPKRIRMGFVYSNLVHNLCLGLLVLLDFTSRKNLNCRIFPQNISEILEISLVAFCLHSCIHWAYFPLWIVNSLLIFGFFMPQQSIVHSKFSIL